MFIYGVMIIGSVVVSKTFPSESKNWKVIAESIMDEGGFTNPKRKGRYKLDNTALTPLLSFRGIMS